MFSLGNKLPDNLPTHWNIKGEVDSYGSKYIFAVLNIALYLLLLIVPRIDPRKKNYTVFSSTYYKLRLILTLFFSLFYLLVIYNAVYARVDFEKIIPISILFLLALIGNYLSTVRSNYFVGIRTPWTLNNEKVWKQTHLFGGKVMFFGGIIGGIISMFMSTPYSQYFAFALMIILLLVVTVYSYIFYRKLESRNEL